MFSSFIYLGEIIFRKTLLISDGSWLLNLYFLRQFEKIQNYSRSLCNESHNMSPFVICFMSGSQGLADVQQSNLHNTIDDG